MYTYICIYIYMYIIYDCLQAHYGITQSKKKVLIQSASLFIGVKAKMLKEPQKSVNIQDSIGLGRSIHHVCEST